jgi:predicted PurR-regulated permease PerM
MDNDFYRRTFLVATIIIVGYTLGQVLQPLWGPLGWAAFVAFLFQPVQRRLTLRLKGRASLSAGILTALTPLFVIAPLTGLGIVFAEQVSSLVDHLQHADWKLDTSAWEASLEKYQWFSSLAGWVHTNVAVTADQIRGWALDGVQTVLRDAASGGGKVVLGAAGTVFGFFIMLFLLYFLFRDGAKMFDHMIRLIPMDPQRRRKLVDDLANVARAVVNGTLLVALFQGMMLGIIFWIAGFPAPVVFGVLAGIVSLLPAAGTPVFWVPGTIYLVVVHRFGMAIFMALWGLGIVWADNMLRPMLIARRAPISELAVFIGVIGGITAFGPVGLVAGPVFLSLVVELLKFADQSFGRSD